MSVKFDEIYSPLYTGPSKLYLYNRGDLCTDVTGGWDKPVYTSSYYTIPITFDSEYMSWAGTSGHLYQIRTVNTFDTTKYTKLVVIYELKQNNTGSNNITNNVYIGFCKNKYTTAVYPNADRDRGAVDYSESPILIEQDTLYAQNCVIKTCNIESLNEHGNFYVWSQSGNYASSWKGKIHEIYLE